ncbi:MAG: TonB-dependent receptor [Bacteroidota bacterium]
MKLKIIIISCFLIIAFSSFAGAPVEIAKVTLSGYIKDKDNGEALIGAALFVNELKFGTVTNVYGFYSISLIPGKYTIKYSYIGYESNDIEIDLSKNTSINIELLPKRKDLSEVVIQAERTNENVTSNQMSTILMKMETIKKIPALMGEVDILKAIQLMPGVQSSGEGGSGFNVRGGSMDQNLILLDEATVYNASHLMGFFSVFNNDAVKELKLYKGDIPAEYGGRLASLLDIRQKDGNSKRICATGGIGTISSRLTLEGPIIKDKTSFLIAGRRSYADLFLPFAKNKDVRHNTLYFYDLNFKLNHVFNQNNRLFLSGYYGRDIIAVGKTDPFKMSWGNSTITARWNHLFSKKLFSNFSYINSIYNYGLGVESSVSGFKWTSTLKDYTLKADMGYYINPDNTVKFGASATMHTFQPGITKGLGGQSFINEMRIPASNALEYGIFASHEVAFNALFSVNYGLRYSIFQNMGKATIYNFDANYNALDSTVYSKGDIFNTYGGLEPRIGSKFILTENSSVKASYSRTMQYIHLASNSTVGTPLDIWLPSTPNIKPQKGDQFAFGYFRNFKKNMFETSIEVYYKKMHNQIDFKDHAQLLMNPQIEGELRFGKANAYGIEFLIRKQEGKFTGWIGYTYSRVKRTFKDINNGNPYSAPYERPHDISIVMSYDLTKRINVSATWVYASGAPITFPTGRFVYGNVVAPVYSDRNSFRIPDYHRLDLGLTYEGKEKPNKRYHGSLTVSVYNAYNRHNTYSISLKENPDNHTETQAWRTYLFPIIPAITYNFKF